ncbi:uncharacterized protein NECHADRAFT_85947 [Fusarium vanettenii 77-13-4]|uniref:Uncharacterized protein n=1 Tax=Fusarium vanettenii (strain ATCC MYA-4622 / CBS 123669 / FGSC 9596 / NRRL 45880 / 77-13-4) TaxID=660122 RepID=C7Z1X2_FUSV7|nr:uncharacterized protein NECHADRAFT_85947 [Fusarium vanettenii 77-13-4]EEU41901.1 predicted protein [Fusarium vanettenii 77-13-4]
MPGLLGTPTFAKMSVDAVGRLWRRLKDKKQGSKQVLEQIVEEALEQGPTESHEQGIEQEQHTFYSDSLDTIGYSSVSDPDTLACVEFVQGWVNGTTGTYDFFGAWRHPSEPSSIGKYHWLSEQHETTDSQEASFDDEADLFRSVSYRSDLVEPAEHVEPAELAEPVVPVVPIAPVKPAKRGIKNAFKSVKAVFKQRNSSD